MARKKIINAASPLVRKDPNTGEYHIDCEIKFQGDLTINLDATCHLHFGAELEDGDFTANCPLIFQNPIQARNVTLKQDTTGEFIFITSSLTALKNLTLNGDVYGYQYHRPRINISGNLTCLSVWHSSGLSNEVRVLGNISAERIEAANLICFGNINVTDNIICADRVVAHKGSISCNRVYAGVRTIHSELPRKAWSDEIYCKEIKGTVACGTVIHDLPNARDLLLPGEADDPGYEDFLNNQTDLA